ncbi:MAG: hypothetical protein J5I59_03785 [Saprospiraceae bacterium]|nr:hypothetical protein [Saprospiraceae bacterium]
MKYAFKDKTTGMISIEIQPDMKNGTIKLIYMDNGIGFDFNAENGKGLGLEIIKGLIGQLDGTSEFLNHNGFCLSISFKEKKHGK